MKNEVDEKAQFIITELLELSRDKGSMVKLRKGLAEETQSYAWPILSRWCNIENTRMRTITQTVAGFFAFYPKHEEGGNFGASLRILALKRNSDPIKGPALLERRINMLLRCFDYADVCERVGFTIRMMKAVGVPINYKKLYQDLCYWGDRVKIRWMSEYQGAFEQKGEKNVPDANKSKS